MHVAWAQQQIPYCWALPAGWRARGGHSVCPALLVKPLLVGLVTQRWSALCTYRCPVSPCNHPKITRVCSDCACRAALGWIWGCVRVRCCLGPAPLRLPGSHPHPLFFFFLELFCTGGWVGVWVFECCYLLFFKGLLALPWGYCNRNSYLCYSPAYRLPTGTKWKNPAHGVLCFVNMFYCPWFSAIRYSICTFFFFFFPFVPTLPGKPCCSIITFIFIFPINCQYPCPFNFNNHCWT